MNVGSPDSNIGFFCYKEFSSSIQVVPVYNNERLNRKGGYLFTPLELYNGKVIDKTTIKNRIARARTEN